MTERYGQGFRTQMRLYAIALIAAAGCAMPAAYARPSEDVVVVSPASLPENLSCQTIRRTIAASCRGMHRSRIASSARPGLTVI